MYELIRKTLIIVLCLMLSKMLNMNVSVYLVLFSILVAMASFSKHLSSSLKILLPSVYAAIGAAIVNQIFDAHPFIIWACCVLYFDYVRRGATNNFRILMATLPLFMVIFITTYHNSGYSESIVDFIRDVILSAFLAALVGSLVNHLMPIKANVGKPEIIVVEVTGADRLKMLVLVGGGLSFIMINQVTSAVFCLVPLITSAMQPTHGHMKQHSKDKILSQVGGCSLAIIAAFLYSGTEVNLISYFIISSLLICLLLLWSHHSEEAKDRAIHADVLMGFLIPYQLYIARYGNDFGLTSISLRAVELVIALMIIYVVAHWLDALGKESSTQTSS